MLVPWIRLTRALRESCTAGRKLVFKLFERNAKAIFNKFDYQKCSSAKLFAS